jgi:hypothetical protein
MAQDWYKAFKVGTDDVSIGLLDENGVAIAAAQALDKRTQDLQKQIAARDAKIASLEARLEKLEKAMSVRK